MSAAETRLQEIIPNFRRVCGTNLYRSSRPDKLTSGSNISLMGKLGIKTIIDLRSPAELPAETVLDSYYEKVSPTKRIDESTKQENKQYLGRHYNFHLMDKQYKQRVFKRLPILWKILTAVLWVIDGLFRTVYSYKVVVSRVLSKEGCGQQYIDIVSSCGERLVKAMELFSDTSNVPALICCAWGKDRTGILCALIQDLCGVEQKVICDEYAQSEKILERKGLGKQMIDHLNTYGLNARYAESKKEAMENVFRIILAEYGTVAEYLHCHGLSKEKIARIIENVKS